MMWGVGRYGNEENKGGEFTKRAEKMPKFSSSELIIFCVFPIKNCNINKLCSVSQTQKFNQFEANMQNCRLHVDRRSEMKFAENSYLNCMENKTRLFPHTKPEETNFMWLILIFYTEGLDCFDFVIVKWC